MAKGVKKIKKLSNSSISGDYYKSGDVICVNPNQEASFVVGEWYNETTEEERRNINWLWMDYNKIKSFKETRKPAGEPYGLTFPKKLCGNYAYYLETSLSGEHNPGNTGVYVFGKCEKKITSVSWSKKQNTADHSEINYGQDLFITLETEGLNGDTLKLELYSQKGSKLIDTIKENCTDGIFKGKFKIKSFYREFPGLPETLENFYVKVINIENEYIKNASGSDKILSFKIIKRNSIITIPVFEVPTNTAPLTIDSTPVEERVRTEGIVTAYFAKEEFTKKTTEVDGQHEYKFANPNIKYDKNKIAGIIKSKVDALVKADKKYAKLDDIKNALVEESYEKDATITFNLCKLGAEYKKINSAPLEEEVYVVAKTFLLDGKEVSITIKEKDAVLGETDADLTVLEAKENGEELTILKATVENGIAKLKVKLRPKADEDLKIWKEKLLKGKKEEAYTYTFKSEKTTITDENKKQFAAIILKNAKEGKQGNTKIATGKTAFVDDVEKALVSKDYISGEAISFDTYKTQAESLWLKAECQGDTVKHEGEFLKRDGEYFVIGKGKCPRCSEDFKYEDILKIFPAADKNKNLAEKLIKEINNIKEKYEINSCIRKAHLINQFGSETGFNTLVEGIDEYSASTLKTLFGYFRRHPDEAETYKGNLYEIAVRAYGLRNVDHETDIISCSIRPGGKCNDLGNDSKEDGYRYIGRGLIQLTDKYNYTQINNEFVKSFPGEGNLINNPELLEDPKYAVMSAFSYWINNKLNLKADLGSKPSDVNEITKIINKHLDESHYEKRRKSFIKAKEVFRLSECEKMDSNNSNSESVTIRLVRKWQTLNSTTGEFTIDNSEIKGFILEEKGPDTTISGMEQRIPIGTYNLILHSGTKFTNVLKLYNNSVSIDRAILIHSGNSASDTEGCLLPGSTRSVDWVSGSRDKLKEIMDFVTEKGIDEAKIIITENYV